MSQHSYQVLLMVLLAISIMIVMFRAAVGRNAEEPTFAGFVIQLVLVALEIWVWFHAGAFSLIFQ